MATRITDATLFRTALADVSRQRLRLAATQERATSGLRINHLSDDPVGVRAATLLKAGLESNQQFQRNVTRGRVRVVATEAALSDANDLLIRTRDLALQARSDTIGPEQLDDLAREAERLHAELLSAANARAGGGFVFGGYAGGASPFVASTPFQDGQPAPTVAFVGDPSEIQIDVDQGVGVGVTLDGRRVFLGDADGDGSPDAGREDLFLVLADLRDALVAGDRDALGTTLDRVDRALSQVSAERARIGASDTRLAGFETKLSARAVDLEQRLSDVQDADSVEVFSDLVNQEAALNAALAASARLLQQSLLDFLR